MFAAILSQKDGVPNPTVVEPVKEDSTDKKKEVDSDTDDKNKVDTKDDTKADTKDQSKDKSSAEGSGEQYLLAVKGLKRNFQANQK